MLALLAVSLIWAFSFGLIGNVLRGTDPCFLAATRLTISFVLFLPFLRTRRISFRDGIELAAIGGMQYGLMYISLFAAFTYLESHEVALFTIFTPLYVTLVNDITTRRFHRLFFATAALAVVGTGIIKYTQLNKGGLIEGFLIMQISNICFATGQVMYRNKMKLIKNANDLQVFALLYCGACVVAIFFAAFSVEWSEIELNLQQTAVLIYLGLVASGLGFFLWNAGARRVNAGTLAVFNNLKIPLAIAVSLLLFGESTNLPRLLTGGLLTLIALVLNEIVVRRNNASR